MPVSKSGTNGESGETADENRLLDNGKNEICSIRAPMMIHINRTFGEWLETLTLLKAGGITILVKVFTCVWISPSPCWLIQLIDWLIDLFFWSHTVVDWLIDWLGVLFCKQLLVLLFFRECCVDYLVVANLLWKISHHSQQNCEQSRRIISKPPNVSFKPFFPPPILTNFTVIFWKPGNW